MTEQIEDVMMFCRCYRDTLRSCLRSWGPIKGWKMAWLWAQYGRDERTR